MTPVRQVARRRHQVIDFVGHFPAHVLHAFLMFNPSWQVLWAAHYMQTRHADAVAAVFPNFRTLGAGGSFWMRRVAGAPQGAAR